MLDDFQDDNELDKGGEFLDEFRQRLNSQPIENLEERKNDINRSQHIFLGTVLGISLAGIVSWFILSPDYAKIEDAEIPVVRRPQAAIKVQPADPGGAEEVGPVPEDPKQPAPDGAGNRQSRSA